MAEHRHQRHDPGPACHEEQRPRQRGVPDEIAADRAAHLDPVADDRDVVEEGRDLAVLDPLDGQVDLAAALRLRGDRIAALDAVAVGGRETKVDMLAGAMARPVREGEGERPHRRRFVADR